MAILSWIRRFLGKSWTLSTPSAVEAAKDDVILDPEKLGRFIFHEREISKQGDRPKHAVFSPARNPDSGILETSVCRIPMASAARLTMLGQTIRATENKAALAIAVVPVGALPTPLKAHAAPEPDYDEHAIIVHWPEGDDNKSARMLLQQEIAAAAEPVTRY